MIAIVDYGVGNLFSIQSSLRFLGADAAVTGDAAVIASAERVILPGVGAFADAAEKLRVSGLDRSVRDAAEVGKPLLGICLGMQLLFDKSFEYGEHDGLGLIPGRVVPMEGVVPADHKIPRIGWNGLIFPEDRQKSELFRYIDQGDHVYFVHSYYAADCGEHVIAYTEYGAPITAAVQRSNVYGTQFHPEKSGQVGLSILRAFCEL